jgi:hypothetical protein
MTPVSVPMQQQHPQKTNSNTSPSMAQWIAYKNSTVSSISPTSSNSSVSSMSSSTSSTSSSNTSNNYNNYYYGNNNCAITYNQPTITTAHYHHQTQPMIPVVARAIPIIDPATKQVFCQKQPTNIPPGFYNVSVC